MIESGHGHGEKRDRGMRDDEYTENQDRGQLTRHHLGPHFMDIEQQKQLEQLEPPRKAATPTAGSTGISASGTTRDAESRTRTSARTSRHAESNAETPKTEHAESCSRSSAESPR